MDPDCHFVAHLENAWNEIHLSHSRGITAFNIPLHLVTVLLHYQPDPRVGHRVIVLLDCAR